MQRLGIFIKQVFFTIILLGLSNAAWAVSASVSSSVGATTVSITANGGFVVDQHCSNAFLLPTDAACPSMYTHQGGSISVYLGGSYLGGKSTSTGSSASFSTTLQRATLSQGIHTVTVSASDSHGSTSSSSTFTIDNTPALSVITGLSGTVRGGPSALAGTADFTSGSNGGLYGSVYAVVYNASGGRVWSANANAGSPSFDLSAFPSIPVHFWANGDYTLQVIATAVNGARAVSSLCPLPTFPTFAA